jgi:hypothetical protein
MNEEVTNILWKKAKGYKAKETVEEYTVQDGEEVLNKRKITVKHVPPDMAALRTYMELTGKGDAESMDDEELQREKERLMEILKENSRCAGGVAHYGKADSDAGTCTHCD